jgi:hypothetical protein
MGENLSSRGLAGDEESSLAGFDSAQPATRTEG